LAGGEGEALAGPRAFLRRDRLPDG